MAIGDRRVHHLAVDGTSTYTPSAGLKERITNVSGEPLSQLEIRHGARDYIRISPTEFQTPYLQQNPAIVLDENTEIRARSVAFAVLDDNGTSTPASLWLASPFDFSSISAPFGNLGSLATGRAADEFGLRSLTTRNGILQTHDGDRLLALDPSNPSNESSPYGQVAVLPAGSFQAIGGMAYIGDQLVFGQSNGQYIQIYVFSEDFTSRISPLGNLGHRPSPSSTVFVRGLGVRGTDLYVLASHSGDVILVKFDSTNFSNTSGTYQDRVVVTTARTPGGMEVFPNGDAYVVYTNREVWRINLDDPASTDDPYGLLGILNASISPTALALITGSEVPATVRVSTVEVL